ncbi:hypothetical protein BC828DRAFT_379500 [Blastocladiella britannica]|nr:hypothetical protein BC828DRAFT_379500 [Blastocladiella britannica]
MTTTSLTLIDLPSDILGRILAHLGRTLALRSLARAATTCRRMRSVAYDDDDVWHAAYLTWNRDTIRDWNNRRPKVRDFPGRWRDLFCDQVAVERTWSLDDAAATISAAAGMEKIQTPGYSIDILSAVPSDSGNNRRVRYRSIVADHPLHDAAAPLKPALAVLADETSLDDFNDSKQWVYVLDADSLETIDLVLVHWGGIAGGDSDSDDSDEEIAHHHHLNHPENEPVVVPDRRGQLITLHDLGTHGAIGAARAGIRTRLLGVDVADQVVVMLAGRIDHWLGLPATLVLFKYRNSQQKQQRRVVYTYAFHPRSESAKYYRMAAGVYLLSYVDRDDGVLTVCYLRLPPPLAPTDNANSEDDPLYLGLECIATHRLCANPNFYYFAPDGLHATLSRIVVSFMPGALWLYSVPADVHAPIVAAEAIDLGQNGTQQVHALYDKPWYRPRIMEEQVAVRPFPPVAGHDAAGDDAVGHAAGTIEPWARRRWHQLIAGRSRSNMGGLDSLDLITLPRPNVTVSKSDEPPTTATAFKVHDAIPISGWVSEQLLAYGKYFTSGSNDGSRLNVVTMAGRTAVGDIPTIAPVLFCPSPEHIEQLFASSSSPAKPMAADSEPKDDGGRPPVMRTLHLSRAELRGSAFTRRGPTENNTAFGMPAAVGEGTTTAWIAASTWVTEDWRSMAVMTEHYVLVLKSAV